MNKNKKYKHKIKKRYKNIKNKCEQYNKIKNIK